MGLVAVYVTLCIQYGHRIPVTKTWIRRAKMGQLRSRRQWQPAASERRAVYEVRVIQSQAMLHLGLATAITPPLHIIRPPILYCIHPYLFPPLSSFIHIPQPTIQQPAMPKFSVEASAQLQNIVSITVPHDYPWHVNLLCCSCRELHDRPAVITSSDVVEGVGHDVNLRISCAFCGKKGTVKIVKDQLSYTQDHSPAWNSLLNLECRGVEPVEVVLADDVPFQFFGANKFLFEDAFLEDGEFFGWDDSNNVEASVTEFRLRIVRD